MRANPDNPKVDPRKPFGTTLFVVCVGYIAALWAESLLVHEASGISYAMLSAGVIIGSFTRIRPERWLLVIGVLAAIKLAWLLAIEGVYGVHGILTLGAAQLAVAFFIATGPYYLLPRRKLDYMSHEIFTVIVLNAIIGAFAYAMLLYYDGSVEGGLLVASAICSVFLGGAITGAPITIWGMVYGKPAKYSWKRITILCMILPSFVVFSFAALNNQPTLIAQFFEPYGYSVIWITLFLAMAVANHSSTQGLIFVLVVVLSSSAVMFQLQPNAQDISALVWWQSTAVVVEVVALVCGVLVAGQRRFSQLAYQRLRIARSMVAASAIADSSEARTARVDLVEALEIAGRHCRADECRLYRFDEESKQAICVNGWIDDPEVIDMSTLAEPVETVRLQSMITQLASDNAFYWEYDAKAAQNAAERDFAEALQLLPGNEIAFYPICFGDRLIGTIGIVGYSFDQLRKRNAAMLISGIGYFYVGVHTRSQAARSIKNYELQLSELAARFSEAEERVRRDTSTEIHDGIIQQLAVMRMKLGELGQRRISAPETLSSITDIVDEALLESRSMLQRLSPSVLYELGLMPALQTLCDKIDEAGEFEVVLRETGTRISIEQSARIAFYHVLKELIDNSLLHSGGRRIWIDIKWGENSIEQASVSDDGNAGVWWLSRPGHGNADRLGLLAASERLQRFDYLLTFLPRDGGGTSAVIRQAMIFSVPRI
ncbi:MAG: histidine kinase [Pseudomonadota bacterium]